MVTIHLTGHVTDDGELIFDAPKDLPPGEVQITIEVPREAEAEASAEADQDFTDDEIRELLTFTPLSGKEVIELGLTGGWADMGITDSEAWVQEQRRKRRERRQW